MLSATDFFDLTDFRHRELFDDTEFVWDALKRLPAYLEAALKPAVRGAVSPGVYVADDVFIGRGTVVEPGAVIHGPTIIGENCQIRAGAYLRGNIVVGDGAIIGHATEVKTAILLDRAGAPHFNYVGDSILGSGCNLGAGSICSNYKLTGEEVVVRIGDREYRTGLTKFGAVVGDGAQVGCNAVLNPGTLLGKNSLAYPLTSLRGYYPPESVIKLTQTLGVAPR